MEKDAILDRAKASFGLVTDTQLAETLGISPQTLSNWRKRNSLDFELLLTKCESADLNWLIRGEEALDETADVKVKILTERLNYLNRILEEKERTIQILMNQKTNLTP